MSDFGLYFLLGWEHLMSSSALDHLLFIAALAIVHTIKNWKPVLILVTAFTVGHSITLALSSLMIVELSSPCVEFLIPCTILLTAIYNLFQKEFTKMQGIFSYVLAFFFGLIHGLAFANTLRFIITEDEHFGWALFGFNIGIECGQILLVLLILMITSFFIQVLKLKHRPWVILMSIAIFLIAIKMAVERWPNKTEKLVHAFVYDCYWAKTKDSL